MAQERIDPYRAHYKVSEESPIVRAVIPLVVAICATRLLRGYSGNLICTNYTADWKTKRTAPLPRSRVHQNVRRNIRETCQDSYNPTLTECYLYRGIVIVPHLSPKVT